MSIASDRENNHAKSGLGAQPVDEQAASPTQRSVQSNSDAAPQKLPGTQPVTDGQASDQPTTMRGRSVFTVETTPAGVVIRTAWMSEENKLMEMPAVFPDMLRALNVLDELRQQVIQHFSQAAQVGSQVIFNQMREQQRLQAEQSNNAMAEPGKATVPQGGHGAKSINS